MKDAIDLGMGAPLLPRARTERRLRELVFAATPALFALAAALMFLSATTEPAAADFRLCNNTASRVGVAVGYKDAEGWTTEGWWNLPSHTCETILKGNLVARFYYVYAIDYDRGGEWMGQAVMCTRDKEFTIRGIADCLARGFDRTGFFEVDTGEQRAWTVQLTESSEQAPQHPLPGDNPLSPTAPANGARATPGGGRTAPSAPTSIVPPANR